MKRGRRSPGRAFAVAIAVGRPGNHAAGGRGGTGLVRRRSVPPWPEVEEGGELQLDDGRLHHGHAVGAFPDVDVEVWGSTARSHSSPEGKSSGLGSLRGSTAGDGDHDSVSGEYVGESTSASVGKDWRSTAGSNGAGYAAAGTRGSLGGGAVVATSSSTATIAARGRRPEVTASEAMAPVASRTAHWSLDCSEDLVKHPSRMVVPKVVWKKGGSA
ncbi:unnamed protein product [Urochloa humidicola]